jgi:hypothetical protein
MLDIKITADKLYAGKCDVTGYACHGALVIELSGLPSFFENILVAQLNGRNKFYIGYDFLEPHCRQIVKDIDERDKKL